MPARATVVGTSKFGLVIVSTTVPLDRSDDSRTTAMRLLLLRTTYSVLPSRRIPSPFVTVAPQSEISWVRPVSG